MIITGKALKVLTSNIDTDQIIPARYLTGISKTGLGKYLFEDLPSNPLDAIDHDGAKIILTLENFGCGSSREHAAWAILDRGFQAVVAASFARIFEDNCYNNGIVPIKLTETEIQEIAAIADGATISVDVINQTLGVYRSNLGKPPTKIYKFELDELKKEFILKGGFMKFLDAKVPAIKAWAQSAS